MSNILAWFKSLFFVRAYFNASEALTKASERASSDISVAVSDARREAAMRAKPVTKPRKKTAAKKKI
jgi:hypothetical protein